MANYFRNIPNVNYDINGTEPNNYLNVTNIMQRIKFKPKVLEDISDYYHTHGLESTLNLVAQAKKKFPWIK